MIAGDQQQSTAIVSDYMKTKCVFLSFVYTSDFSPRDCHLGVYVKLKNLNEPKADILLHRL